MRIAMEHQGVDRRTKGDGRKRRYAEQQIDEGSSQERINASGLVAISSALAGAHIDRAAAQEC